MDIAKRRILAALDRTREAVQTGTCKPFDHKPFAEHEIIDAVKVDDEIYIVSVKHFIPDEVWAQDLLDQLAKQGYTGLSNA